MPDRPLSDVEERMARDLCALVMSWNVGVSVERAHEVVGEVWNESAAQSWFETADSLRQAQMESMARAMEPHDADEEEG